MTLKPDTLQTIGTASFLTLIVFLTYRTGWLSPPGSFPKSLALLLMVGPLIFPLRGMLHGRPYTHGWALFLSLLYFTIGVLIAADVTTRWEGILIILLSTGWFMGSMLFLRALGKIRKAAEAEAEKTDNADG